MKQIPLTNQAATGLLLLLASKANDHEIAVHALVLSDQAEGILEGETPYHADQTMLTFSRRPEAPDDD